MIPIPSSRESESLKPRDSHALPFMAATDNAAEPGRFDSNAAVLGRIGTLETRLARSRDEVLAAQRLRYRVFHGEMGARLDPRAELQKRDFDAFDPLCDHLLVLNEGEIVGTYRVMPQTFADAAAVSHASDPNRARFYSESEFDLCGLLRTNGSEGLLELGRSCIEKAYRTKRTMELMWAGVWAYALQKEVRVLFGCASFAGTNPGLHAAAFGWLAEHALLERDEDCPTRTGDAVDLRSFCLASGTRTALGGLPPLLKGYLRLGARIGSQAYVDHAFGTIDVLVVLKVRDINPRYIAHYGADGSRFAD